MSSREKAVGMIRTAAQAETLEDRVERIPLYIKMYRHDIDRENIKKILSDLMDSGVIEAAWAVIELKIQEKDEEYPIQAVFGEMTK